jgi:hypothetical protein
VKGRRARGRVSFILAGCEAKVERRGGAGVEGFWKLEVYTYIYSYCKCGCRHGSGVYCCTEAGLDELEQLIHANLYIVTLDCQTRIWN